MLSIYARLYGYKKSKTGNPIIVLKISTDHSDKLEAVFSTFFYL